MKVKVKDLVIDKELISLRPINFATVSQYRQAMRAGDIFPRPIIEKGTNVIVSGNHRVKSFEAEYGEDHTIDVIVKEYKNRAALLKEFAKENAKHGMPLAGYTKREITLKLLQYGVKQEEVATIFGVSVKRIIDWAGMSVVVVGKKGKKETHTLKRGLEHLVGEEIKPAMYEEHRKKDRGIPAYSQAQQLTRWLKDGWIQQDDDKSIFALKELYEELINFFSQKGIA